MGVCLGLDRNCCGSDSMVLPSRWSSLVRRSSILPDDENTILLIITCNGVSGGMLPNFVYPLLEIYPLITLTCWVMGCRIDTIMRIVIVGGPTVALVTMCYTRSYDGQLLVFQIHLSFLKGQGVPSLTLPTRWMLEIIQIVVYGFWIFAIDCHCDPWLKWLKFFNPSLGQDLQVAMWWGNSATNKHTGKGWLPLHICLVIFPFYLWLLSNLLLLSSLTYLAIKQPLIEQ